ncbi:PHD finger protein 14 isoform X7 [Choristoneura fumiferana]|uniref:PHD finger protein 14 isoform X7 n=1 Tax=Choristoneura fumiferana TaxID=7141 RepID=UPI003D15A161
MSNPGRDPAKRKVKPVEPQSLLDFDLGEGESSDDSDFRIEDHPEESDDYSINSDDDDKKGKDDSGSSEESASDAEDGFKNTSKMGQSTVSALLERAKQAEFKIPGDLANWLICAGCLGSRSDDFNEIVECDGCGVTVHEGCYGVSDVTSESSTVSSASTEPWFCEACKAGVTDPSCELCPNKGGIFKETEVGAWVHLVCALYVPGVAFSEVERLSGVTLFEMAYSRWGARSCALCEDTTLARTGVCVGCDAGLCKTFFHVTCGQRAGLLAEAHSEEAEQADPFYAHCRLHSDKTLVKKRKRNWLALQIRTEKRKLELQENLSPEEKARIKRKLIKYRRKYLQQKENRNPPWVPTQKMARMLYSSASAMRKFQRKAELMGVDTHALEFQDAQMAALKDVSRRWHVPPAFSVEFVGYYLERNSRVTSLRRSLERLTKENETLLGGDEKLRTDYDDASKENTDTLAELASTKQALQKIYDAIIAICPKPLPPLMEEKPLLPPVLARSTPKVTPLQLQKRDNPDAHQGKVLSTSLEEPKERDSKAIESSIENTLANLSSDIATYKANRKRRKEKHRSRYSPDFLRSPSKSHKHKRKKKTQDMENPEMPHPRITIKIKPIPKPDGSLDTQMFYVPTDSNDGPPPAVMRKLSKHAEQEAAARPPAEPMAETPPPPKKEMNKIEPEKSMPQVVLEAVKTLPKSARAGRSRRDTGGTPAAPPADLTPMTHCDVCREPGDPTNLVRCDECFKRYHFTCLEPPLNKNPKKRGYSWHCADCDPTDVEENN